MRINGPDESGRRLVSQIAVRARSRDDAQRTILIVTNIRSIVAAIDFSRQVRTWRSRPGCANWTRRHRRDDDVAIVNTPGPRPVLPLDASEADFAAAFESTFYPAVRRINAARVPICGSLHRPADCQKRRDRWSGMAVGMALKPVARARRLSEQLRVEHQIAQRLRARLGVIGLALAFSCQGESARGRGLCSHLPQQHHPFFDGAQRVQSPASIATFTSAISVLADGLVCRARTSKSWYVEVLEME